MADEVLRLILEHTGECLMRPPGKAGVGAAGVRHRVEEGEAGRFGARRDEAGGGCEGDWQGCGGGGRLRRLS